MKTRHGFVSNSSSTSFIITNKTKENKTIADFVKENPQLITQYNTEYDKQYTQEQQTLQQRVAELDKQLLDLKQQLVKTEAHIGPITYVAKVFDFAVDDATMYLILLIIFAFDPMAVALTLAVNVVLELRRNGQLSADFITWR